MNGKLNNLYQDPKISYPFNDLKLPFQEYIQRSRDIIAKSRLDLEKNASLIIETNSPFELKPTTSKGRLGALLLHGLLDSAFVMKDIGQKLNEKGLLVRALTLPGHGTRPGAMLNVTMEEWQQAVRYGVESFKNEVDRLILVGYSTGGSLAIQEVLSHSSDFIAGLILIAPALKIKSKLAFLSQWHQSFAKLSERAAWVTLTDEFDYAKYRSITFNSVYQVYRLSQLIDQTLSNKQIQQPQCIVLSLDDKTICSKKALSYFEKHKNPKNHLLMYAPSSADSYESRIVTRPVVYPEQHILNISHIGLPNSPLNPHYGKHGDYPGASVPDPKVMYDEILAPEEALNHLLYKLKLTRYLKNRLTYNPDFDFMMQSISQFIEQIFSV